MFGFSSLQELVAGQLSLSAGSLFYTLWWLSAFKPGAHGSGGGALSMLWFLLLAVFGLGGVALSIMGIHGLPFPAHAPGTGLLAVGALILYFLLLAVSTKIFGRQPTTELLLIVCWALLEICVIAAFRGAGQLMGISFPLGGLFVAAATVIAFAAYMAYYRMDDNTAYIMGAVPLVIDGLVTLFLGLAA